MKRADARELLKESRSLRKRAKGVADETIAEIEAAEQALRDAVKAKSDLAAPGQTLMDLLDAHMKPFRKNKLREYTESVGVAVLIALTLRAFAFEAFQIPTGSMEPTLLVGDHLFVSKSAYGVRVPFTTRYMFQWRDIARGDIVVFLFPVEEVATQVVVGEVTRRLENYAARNGGYPATLDAAGVPAESRVDGWGRPFSYALADGGFRFVSAGADATEGTADDITNADSAFVNGVDACLDRASLVQAKDYIKRVIGLPGDRVSVVNNVIHVNGEPIARTDARAGDGTVHLRTPEAATETMSNGTSYTTWTLGASPNFDEIEVREGHVFVMGDSRDNSSDGRCWGQVPIENVKGRSMFIFFSRDRTPASMGGPPNWFASIRWSRFFDPVR